MADGLLQLCSPASSAVGVLGCICLSVCLRTKLAARALPPCSNLASDDGMQQMQYLLSGMFGRACKSLGSPAGQGSLVEEVGDLRRALTDKLAGAGASPCAAARARAGSFAMPWKH